MADWLRRRTSAGRIITIAFGMLLGGALAVVLLLLRDMAWFKVVFAASIFFLTFYNGPIAAAIFDVVPARIGATVAGAYLLFIHLAGDAIAFPLVGGLSDRFGIQKAVLLLPVVAMIGGLVVLMAVRTVGQDMERRLDG
jgi:sugar phosphate permease